MRPLTRSSGTVSVQRTQRMLLYVWLTALAPKFVYDYCSCEGECTFLPLMERLVAPGTAPLYVVAVSPLTPSKRLRTNPLRSFPGTTIPYPCLKWLSHLPLQRWRGRYQLLYFSRISTFLCFVIHLLESNEGKLERMGCPIAGKRIHVHAGVRIRHITTANSVGMLMSLHLSNYRRLVVVSVPLGHSIVRRRRSCRRIWRPRISRGEAPWPSPVNRTAEKDK
jgi:hypothetical protein